MFVELYKVSPQRWESSFSTSTWRVLTVCQAPRTEATPSLSTYCARQVLRMQAHTQSQGTGRGGGADPHPKPWHDNCGESYK